MQHRFDLQSKKKIYLGTKNLFDIDFPIRNTDQEKQGSSSFPFGNVRSFFLNSRRRKKKVND